MMMTMLIVRTCVCVPVLCVDDNTKESERKRGLTGVCDLVYRQSDANWNGNAYVSACVCVCAVRCLYLFENHIYKGMEARAYTIHTRNIWRGTYFGSLNGTGTKVNTSIYIIASTNTHTHMHTFDVLNCRYTSDDTLYIQTTSVWPKSIATETITIQHNRTPIHPSSALYRESPAHWSITIWIQFGS